MKHLELESLLDSASVALLCASTDNDLQQLAPALDEIRKAAEQAQLTALKDATESIIANIAAGNGNVTRELITAFVGSAQTYLIQVDDAVFTDLLASLKSTTPSGNATPSTSPDFAPDVDPQFLVEFIEKHLGMMEEFEATILDGRTTVESLSGEDRESAEKELAEYSRRYLHNIKGDAGAIGLIGLERLFHYLEDKTEEGRFSDYVDALLEIPAWTANYLKRLSQGERPKGEAGAYLERLRSSGSAPASTPPTGVPDYTNHDLLAELMSDPLFTEAAPASTAPTTPVTPPVATVQSSAKSAPPVPSVGTTYELTGEADLLQEFMLEAEEHLSSVENLLLETENLPDKQGIDSLFRSIHTIKGSSGYFSLKAVTETSHHTESLLDEIRTGKRAFDRGMTDLLLQYLDVQRKLFAEAKAVMGKSGEQLLWSSYAVDYLHTLHAYARGASLPAAAATSTTEASDSPSREPAEKSDKSESEKLEVKSYVKIETRRLDQLLDAIGEMGIYSSMLVQRCKQALSGDETTQKVTHQVEKITRDVQNIGMSMRLIPIRGLFQKMSRLVWDLGKKVQKEVRFTMEGEDTELDRTMIDRLADPLMHMIRNALDHGLETPDQRAAAGKPRAGSVRLSAYHSGGNIHICIQDDGRGMDPEKLRSKAIEKGIISADAHLSQQECYQLIFAAGFSTAAVVTDVSGRGVGMDVVKRNIELMRGRIHIDSTLGRGTTFTIELPLTLAIMDGIEVSAGSQRFIIPMLSIIEAIRPQQSLVTKTLDRAETYQFRGKFLPIFRLHRLFGVQDGCRNLEEGHLVVVEAHGQRYALFIDEVIGARSTVIKSLGTMFKENMGVAGCAIGASGDVSLILDVHSLLSLARDTYEHDRDDHHFVGTYEGNQERIEH